MSDLRFAFRQLVMSPGFTAVALLTLALGIGVNTTAFSVLNKLLLHTVPYPEPDSLVRVYRTSPQSKRWPHSVANYIDARAQNQVFERMAAIQWTNVNLAEPGQPADRLPGLAVTADFFPLLRVQPELGRVFTAEEDVPGRDAVVVLSHATWMLRFGGASDILGREVRINGRTVTVIGVMPESFEDHQLWGEIAAWQPIAFSPEALQDRSHNYLNAIARLKPGVSLKQAQSAMSTFAAQLAAAHPEHSAENGLRLVDLGSSVQDGTGRRITWFVMGLAGFVLLIACANLANLQFARNVGRGREHAIRAALGASRLRLLGRVLLESLLLSLIGGGLGLIVALWSNELIGRNFVWGDRVGMDIPIDLRVLGFTLVASVVTGIGFGILPAWMASKTDINSALKQGSRGTSSGREQHRLRQILIVAEVALSLTLLAGAGFFISGLKRFTQLDPGWRTEGILIASLNLRGDAYKEDEARLAFYDQLQQLLSALPGVERATLASSLPTWGYGTSSTFVAEGQPEPKPGRAPLMSMAAIHPGFFNTFDIELIEGRTFDAGDTATSPKVVVINETMARNFWPGESALGKRIGEPTPYMSEPRLIVGVVRDTRAAAELGEPDTRFQTYLPLSQMTTGYAAIAVRTTLAPETLAQDLRRTVAEIDSDQAAFRISPLRSAIDRSLASIGVAAWSLVSFAALGVLLAAIGIYGVIAHSVAQRTNEIGIRLALGAQVRDVFSLILGAGMRLTLLGIALGLGGAFTIAHLLRSVSEDLSRGNTAVMIGVTALLTLVAAFACWIPARRATRVNPIEALRSE